jgi:predicted RNase H-like nuclease
MAATFVGVDWSSEGWLAVAFDGEGYDHTEVFGEIGELWQQYEEREPRILINIPIGLIESGAEQRRCDEVARSVLGPLASAVLTPPVREATRKRRYPAAKRVNERKSGNTLSKSAFAISDKIAAVDDLLRNVPEARTAFRESHSEICFRALAGEPLRHSKRKAGGYAERMRILASHDADAPPVVQAVAEATGGADVAIDDVIDAVVLAYTAKPASAPLRSLPADPPTDDKGLPMEIVYRAPDPLVDESAE